MKDPGYYYTTIESITMECYNTKSPPGTNSGVSYTYNSATGTNDTVIDGDKKTVLASLQGTGTDMDAGAPPKDGNTKTQSAHSASSTAAQIPGQGGASGQDHSGSDSNQSGSNSDSGSGSGSSSGSSSGGSDGSSSGGSGSGSSANPSNCDPTKFNANCGSSSSGDSGSGSSSGNGSSTGTKSSASALAMIIAGAALFWL